MYKRLFIVFSLFLFFSCTSVNKDHKVDGDSSIVVEKNDNKIEHNGHTHELPKISDKELTDRTIVIDGGDYSEPCLCRSGDMIFLENGGAKLMLLKKDEKEPVVLIEEGRFSNNVAWSKKCDKVYYKEKRADFSMVIKSVNITTKKVELHEDFPPLTQLKSLSVSDTVYFLDRATLQVKAMYEGKGWTLTKDDNAFYQLSVSPNGKYFVVHSGAKVFLYTTAGKFVRELGLGIASDWSPNSKFLIGFKDESKDGHIISNSDLYLYDITKNIPKKITNTADAFEAWPVFKNDKELIFSDMLRKGIYSKSITIN